MADIDLVTFKCDKCKAEYQISKNVFYRRRRKKLPNYCKACMKEYTNKKKAEHYNNLSPEEKEKYVEKRNWYSRASEEEKEKFKKKMQDIEKAKTPEQKAEENRKNSEGLKKHWATVSEEDKLKRVAPMLDAAHSKWSDMTPEERSEYQKNWYKNLSVKTKEKMTKISRENITKYNNSLTYEEKLEQIQPMLEWQKNLTQEEKDKIYQRRTEEWWNKLTLEEKIEYNHKKYAGIMKHNKFNEKFETRLNESGISKRFSIKREFLMGTEFHHSWDYAFFKDNELVMLVDTDGSYYHGDKLDYKSLMYLNDVNRSKSVDKDNIKVCIIYEDEFDKSFELMCKELDMTYDKFINHRITMYTQPFPAPKYSDKDLIKSFKLLNDWNIDNDNPIMFTINNQIGVRIIDHFYGSRYYYPMKNKIAPIKAWTNDSIKKELIMNNTLYHSYINRNKIVQGYSYNDKYELVELVPPGIIKILITKYLSEYNDIFDPSIRFGETLLASISLNKNFIGNIRSFDQYNETINMIKFLKNHKLISDGQIQIDNNESDHECLISNLLYHEDIDYNLDFVKSPLTLSDNGYIKYCINNYNCKRYLFITSEKTASKYDKYIVDKIEDNTKMNIGKICVLMINK